MFFIASFLVSSSHETSVDKYEIAGSVTGYHRKTSLKSGRLRSLSPLSLKPALRQSSVCAGVLSPMHYGARGPLSLQ